jgi:hypothetical protein
MRKRSAAKLMLYMRKVRRETGEASRLEAIWKKCFTRKGKDIGGDSGE